MILRRIELNQFRRHNRPTVLDLDGKFTIVHGSNETGKSTFFQALEYAFFRRSGAGGADVERLAPWGSSGLSPAVQIEFQHGGAEYRLNKSWGAGCRTLLAKRDDLGAFAPFRADDADDFVTEIFAGEPPGKGQFAGFRAQHLGLAHLLFAPQGRIPIVGDEHDVALNARARARVTAIVGACAQSPAEAKIARAVKHAYEAVFTQTGRPRKGAQSTQSASQLDEVQRRLADRRAALHEFDRLVDALGIAEQEHASATQRALEARLVLELERPRFTQAVQRKASLELAERAYADATKRYGEAVQRKQDLEEGREALVKAQREHLVLDGALSAAKSGVREAEAARRAALAAWNVASADDLELTAWRRQLEALRRAARLCEERAALIGRRDDVETCTRGIARAEQRLAKLPNVDEATIAELERLVERERELRCDLEAARTSLTFTATRAADVHATSSEGERNERVAVGETFQVASDGHIHLRIAGMGEVEVRGPVTDLAAGRRDLENTTEAIAAIARVAGSRDVAVLRVARAKVEALLETRAEIMERRARILGTQTALDLHARIAAIDAENVEAAPAAVHAEFEAKIAERSALDDERRAIARAALNDCERALMSATETQDALRSEHTESEVKRLAPLVERIRHLTAGVASDVERETKLREAYEAREDAAFKLRAERIAYQPYADLGDPQAALEAADAKAESLAGLAHEAALRREGLLAEIKVQREAAPGAQLARLEEERTLLLAQLERERCEERALALLQRLIDDADRTRIAGFAAPVLARVAPWYERVTGKTLAELDLDEHHALRGLRLAGVDHAIEFDELSAGAGDQLGLLIRLGYASLLTVPERLGPMPVLLDDPLVNGDDRRRGRLLEILRELSEQAQVIVFTCRPEDYSSAGGTFARIGDRALAERAS